MQPVHLRQERGLRFIVGRAHRGGPLEEKVLQKVGDSGVSREFVYAPDPVLHHEGNDGCPRPGEDKEPAGRSPTCAPGPQEKARGTVAPEGRRQPPESVVPERRRLPPEAGRSGRRDVGEGDPHALG